MEKNLDAKPYNFFEEEEYLKKGWIRVADFCHEEMKKQRQYAIRYVLGDPPEIPALALDPKFGEPLRVAGEVGNFECVIHPDDIEEFLKRYHKFINER